MNQTMMHDKATLWSCKFRCAATAFGSLVMLLASVTTPAAAACDSWTGQKTLGVVRNLQFFAPQNHQVPQTTNDNNSIVGLWHVNYTDSNGVPFLETFDMWHSDGTEFETANSAPATGNYCLGVWKQIGPRTVQLNHIGWAFNPDGSSAGYFTITETNTLNPGGDTYTGTFDFKVYDINGNLVFETTGTQLAKRITV